SRIIAFARYDETRIDTKRAPPDPPEEVTKRRGYEETLFTCSSCRACRIGGIRRGHESRAGPERDGDGPRPGDLRRLQCSLGSARGDRRFPGSFDGADRPDRAAA